MTRSLTIVTLLLFTLMPMVGQVEYETEIQPIFNANCTGCHGSSGGLSLAAGVSYNNLVGIPSNQQPSINLVEPEDPANSYLYMKITGAEGISGQRMPIGGQLSNADITTIETWINEGALVTGIEEPMAAHAKSFNLFRNYPNPFNPSTTISFSLNAVSDIRLQIYNLNGQLITTIASGQHPVGLHEYQWNGTDANGKSVASGIYIYALQTRFGTQYQRMHFIK
jgi:hypothetical protein